MLWTSLASDPSQDSSPAVISMWTVPPSDPSPSTIVPTPSPEQGARPADGGDDYVPTMQILQLSDTHFLEPGRTPEGGVAYDTAAAFDAVHDHAPAEIDLVVVTGDVADHGRAEQYRIAADRFARFKAPVNLCPGNHDRDAEFFAGIGRPGVSTSRVVQGGGWCFLFVDSNAGAMIPTPSGLHVDQDNDDRLRGNGALGEREAAWVRRMCATTSAEHVFVWTHHPPDPGIALVDDDDYAAEWADLLVDLPQIKGIGAGHTHVPARYELHDREVFVAPSLKNNFDLEAQTWLPPGYRTYSFDADGTITSEVHLVDDDQWPRRPLGRAIMSLFRGEITYDELAEIVARRRSRDAGDGS